VRARARVREIYFNEMVGTVGTVGTNHINHIILYIIQ
jgi:hypothetical protein